MPEAALILLLAQTCVAEISLQPSPDECFYMWEINERTARRRGVDLADHTRRYNAYWKVEHTSRAWIGALALDGRRPAGWPGNLAWDKHRPRWLAVCAAAADFVADVAAGTYRARCPKAGAYGGTPDDGVGADDPVPCPGARRVQCGRRHLQAYWNIIGCRAGRRLRASVAAGKGQTKPEPRQIRRPSAERRPRRRDLAPARRDR